MLCIVMLSAVMLIVVAPFLRRPLIRAMEQCALRNVYNYLNINIYSYLETSGGNSINLYLNVVCFFNTSVN